MKPIKFKIKPGYYNPYINEYRHYYHVWVFRDNQEMWKTGAMLSSCSKDQNGGYAAITIPVWRERYQDGKIIKAPKIGNVLFSCENLSIASISHEAVHMATSYLRFLGLLKLSDQIDEDEERLAYCICYLTNQVSRKAMEKGIEVEVQI